MKNLERSNLMGQTIICEVIAEYPDTLLEAGKDKIK